MEFTTFSIRLEWSMTTKSWVKWKAIDGKRSKRGIFAVLTKKL